MAQRRGLGASLWRQLAFILGQCCDMFGIFCEILGTVTSSVKRVTSEVRFSTEFGPVELSELGSRRGENQILIFFRLSLIRTVSASKMSPMDAKTVPKSSVGAPTWILVVPVLGHVPFAFGSKIQK